MAACEKSRAVFFQELLLVSKSANGGDHLNEQHRISIPT